MIGATNSLFFKQFLQVCGVVFLEFVNVWGYVCGWVCVGTGEGISHRCAYVCVCVPGLRCVGVGVMSFM